MLSVLSALPDSMVRPSGENATELIDPECPSKVLISFPVVTSQSLSVLSSLPETTVRLFGENATGRTDIECIILSPNLDWLLLLRRGIAKRQKRGCRE
jgi:hypothetical protein